MRAQQLVHEIKSMETSMSTMLLPHFEICRTITTAYVASSHTQRGCAAALSRFFSSS